MPIRDILISAMRVCKLWKKVVEECPEIQQALFFKALPGGYVKEYTQEIESLEEVGEGEKGKFWACDDQGPAVEVMRNPLLCDAGDFRGRHGSFVNRSRQWTAQRYTAIRRDDASWRKMLATQPPIRTVEACVEHRFRTCHTWFLDRCLYLYANLEGIRLGDLGLPRWSWESGFEGMKIIPRTGDEVVRMEKPRPSGKAVMEEPDDLSGVKRWRVVELGSRTTKRRGGWDR